MEMGPLDNFDFYFFIKNVPLNINSLEIRHHQPLPKSGHPQWGPDPTAQVTHISDLRLNSK